VHVQDFKQLRCDRVGLIVFLEFARNFILIRANQPVSSQAAVSV
jgi:hypothetical protein